MAKVKVTRTYDTEAAKIWALVSKGNNMHQYLPEMITSCEISDASKGGKRICNTAQGVIEETIITNNDDTMTFEYSIDNDDAPMPVQGYVGRAVMKDLGNGKTKVSWSATYEPKGMAEEELTGMLHNILGTLMDNINKAAG